VSNVYNTNNNNNNNNVIIIINDNNNIKNVNNNNVKTYIAYKLGNMERYKVWLFVKDFT